MESNLISLGHIQGEKFTVDNENEEVKGKQEGDLEIKDYDLDVGEINLINWKNNLKHNKDIKYGHIYV